MPVLRANRALRAIAPGALLRVRATDPASQQDFPSFCRTTGHTLVEAKEDGAAWVFVLRKKMDSNSGGL
jgi:tRNA 2-thiouridine synthesizing protein A